MSIIAFGDLALAAGPENFVHYLAETQKSFFSASSLSLNLGASPEERELLHKLRIALCEAYLSILHGIHNDEIQVVGYQNPVEIEKFTIQMFQYLEGLVQQTELLFPPELLKPMYDLYLDIMAYYVPRDPSERVANQNIFKLIM